MEPSKNASIKFLVYPAGHATAGDNPLQRPPPLGPHHPHKVPGGSVPPAQLPPWQICLYRRARSNCTENRRGDFQRQRYLLGVGCNLLESNLPGKLAVRLDPIVVPNKALSKFDSMVAYMYGENFQWYLLVE
jgi:hypothetical protein